MSMRAAVALVAAVLWAPAARAEKEWTVLLYLQAGGDLTSHALRDLRSIECAAGAASGARHDVVAQLDRGARNGVARLRVDGARRPCGPAVELDSAVVAIVGERDGAPEGDRFRAFVEWAIDRYPARHVLV